MRDGSLILSGQSEIRRHWCAVLACFITAIFAWGIGFYGQSVYLPALQAREGWSTFLIASATTTFYLAGAVAVTRGPVAIKRLGPPAGFFGGAVRLGFGSRFVFPSH